MSAKSVVEDVFTQAIAEKLWTANTQVYPATLQGFSVGSLLPAVFYMFRRGLRRGAGSFQDTFGLKQAEAHPAARARIQWVAQKLSSQRDRFEGFDTELTHDILGDLLLCDSLENKKRVEGHEAEIMRAFPVHFFSSWLDLPTSVGHLRLVPEMLVALLANQQLDTATLQTSTGAFGVASNRPQQNLLLKVFGKGTNFGFNANALAGAGVDAPDEASSFSIEEWLMIRLAQTCGQAPEQARRGRGAIMPEIPNLWPLATAAAEIFREDLGNLLQHFGEAIPRRALTPMLEGFIGLGLWHTFFASLLAVTKWEQSGNVPSSAEQLPYPFFVDASNGTNSNLRDLSEASTHEASRFIDDAVVALAVVRVLDSAGRSSRRLRDLAPTGSNHAVWLNLLGQVRRGDHPASDSFIDALHEKMINLVEKLKETDASPDALAILQSEAAESDPARAIANALCAMMGDKMLKTHYLKFIDSAAMVTEPHGFVKKRSISRKLSSGKARRMDARSVVLSNTLLETLVHVHLAARKGRLSFSDFLALLRTRYGLWVDEAPPSITAAREDLQRNRAVLERRLRDLGLLVGVNDAESMKRLRARYHSTPISE